MAYAEKKRDDRDFDKLERETDEFLRNGADGKYMNQIQEVCDRRRKTICIDLNDADEELANRAVLNCNRFLSHQLPEAIDNILEGLTPSVERDAGDRDVLDVLMDQRVATNGGGGAAAAAADNMADAQNTMPPELKRRYQLTMMASAKSKASSVREVKANNIGQLVTVRGMVTRVTDVRPLMTVAAYTCEQCGYEIYQEVKNKSFMPLMTCPAPMCATNRVNGRIHLQTRASKMVKYQEIKVCQWRVDSAWGWLALANCRSDEH